MEERTCCGFCVSRTGAIGAGVYSLMLCILMETLGGVALYQMTEGNIDAVSSNQELFGVPSEVMTVYVALAVYGLWLLFSVLLLVGVAIKSSSLTLPWLIYLLLVCIFQCAAIIRYFLLLNVVFSHPLYASAFVIFVVSLLCNFYAFSVVKQFRNDVLREISASQENLVNNLALYNNDLRIIHGKKHPAVRV